jgi:septal ring factor EnvC (AmiA/AmiB activator)
MVDPHLTAADEYHVLLAEMERVSVDLGQFVVTGEPVVVMGDGAQLAVAKAGAAKPSSARTGVLSIQAHGGPQTKA